MPRSSFEGKFLSKLTKIDKQEIQGFLSHLVREKNFLEIIFNALVDGIVVLRPNLEVLYVNNVALDLLGVNPKRGIVGERFTDVCGKQGGLCELVARFALQRERVSGKEIELAGTEAAQLISVTIIPLEADNGSAQGSVVMILHDVTQSRQVDEQRRRAERATAFATLAAGLAHEIKNPLNSLQIHAQLLQRALREGPRAGGTGKAAGTRMLQSVDIILEEIQRLSLVVNNFLSAVRPTRPMFQRSDINTVVEHVVAMLRPEAEQRRVRLFLALDHDIPPVLFDPNQMTQAVLNLVKNALEALGDQPDGKVEIRTQLSDGQYRIHVVDNGPGIPDDVLKRIFEPYFTTKFQGTGLGLAIVLRIVEEHGGEIEVYPREAQGTVVSLCFPLDFRPVRLLEDARVVDSG